jgi:hypothetical protein
MSEAAATLDHVNAGNLARTLRSLGIVTTAELLAAGMTSSKIKVLAERGELISLRRGVYLRAEHVRQQRASAANSRLLPIAAALAVVPDAIVSHQSAAELHGIALLGKPCPTVTLTGNPGCDRHQRTGLRLHTASVPDRHITTICGLPVTTAGRSVTDLSRELDFRAGVIAADSALLGKLTTRAELQFVLAECHGWRGSRCAAEVVAFADGRAESPLESIARVLFRELGLPPPQLQAWLGGPAEPIARVDFYWQEFRTVAEVDGAVKYKDPARAAAQLRRDSLLRAEGFEVVHFDWQEITQCPDLVATRIRAAFNRAILLRQSRAPSGQMIKPITQARN